MKNHNRNKAYGFSCEFIFQNTVSRLTSDQLSSMRSSFMCMVMRSTLEAIYDAFFLNTPFLSPLKKGSNIEAFSITLNDY